MPCVNGWPWSVFNLPSLVSSSVERAPCSTPCLASQCCRSAWCLSRRFRRFSNLQPTPSIRVTYVSGKVEEFRAKQHGSFAREAHDIRHRRSKPAQCFECGAGGCVSTRPSCSNARWCSLILRASVRRIAIRLQQLMQSCPNAMRHFSLFSADPPITEIEIDYLARIRKTVARLIIVLNKIDIVESHERQKAVTFLRDALVDHAAPGSFHANFLPVGTRCYSSERIGRCRGARSQQFR